MTTTVVLRAPLALGAIVLAVATPAAQGQAVLYAFHGDSALDGLGTFAAGAGDVNGDGFGDVIAGAPGDDNNGSDSGSARVFSGADGTILYMFNGSSADDLFGWSVDGAGDAFGNSVDGAGDLDGDGFSDLIVGAPSNNTFGKQAGMVQAFSGKDGSILYTRYGSKSHRFGWSVRGAGDVNADNLDDVIVGVWGDNNNGPFSGGARVLGGNTGSILHAFFGDSPGDHFGSSVSGAGVLMATAMTTSSSEPLRSTPTVTNRAVPECSPGWMDPSSSPSMAKQKDRPWVSWSLERETWMATVVRT